MEWEEVMRNISKGEVGRDKILADPALLNSIDEAEPDHKKRNKNRRFLEKILTFEDGMMWLFVIERFRSEFKEIAEKKKWQGLNAVLEEWAEQGKKPQTNDSLTQVLLSFSNQDITIPIEFQCFSVIAHCKRIRGGSGVINENAEIARKLAKDAENTLNAIRDGQHAITNDKNFSLTPSFCYDLAIGLQGVLCDSRFGSIDDVQSKVEKLNGDIKKEHELRNFHHRPDLHLLWWTNLVTLRCAAVCSDLETWKKTRITLQGLEGEDATSGLLRYNKSRSTNYRNEELITYRRITAVNELLAAWRNFHDNFEENESVRKKRASRKPKQRDLITEVNQRYGVFNDKLAEFKLFTHHFEERNLPSHVRHTYSVRDKDRCNKTSRIIGETSTAVQSICLSDIFYTVHILDILHRLLIYRLWWESRGYGGDDGESELFSVRNVLDILKKIKLEIRIRAEEHGKLILKEVDLSIRTIESIHQEDPADYNTRLQKIVDHWQKLDVANLKRTHIKDSIMGLIFTTNEKVIDGERERPSSPHEYIDPMMPMVGPKKDYTPVKKD